MRATLVGREAEAIASRSPLSGAVFAMTLCAGALIASEFLPVSLLTPVVSDLQLSEGQAGRPSRSRASLRSSPACSCRGLWDASTAAPFCWPSRFSCWSLA
jgi:hypothetical protein